MDFYQGTVEEFLPWEEECEKKEGIPNENTKAYSEFIEHPKRLNDGIWKFGKYDTLKLPKLTLDEAIKEGYFGEI